MTGDLSLSAEPFSASNLACPHPAALQKLVSLLSIHWIGEHMLNGKPVPLPVLLTLMFLYCAMAMLLQHLTALPIHPLSANISPHL